MKLGILGCGQLGKSLAGALRTTRFRPCVVVSRRLGSARLASKLAGGCSYGTEPSLLVAADAIVLCVPDDQIATAVSDLVRGARQAAADLETAEAGRRPARGRSTHESRRALAPVRPLAGRIVLHTSGVHSSAILGEAREAGAVVASFHPIQTFARVAPELFRGIYFAIDGEEPALRFCRTLARALGARTLTIAPEARPLYHAALSIGCNFFQTIEWIASELLEEARVKAPLRVIRPLLCSTLANLADVGFPQALTGPISRSDLETVRAHIEALERHRPELARLYRHVGRWTVGLAQLKGTITPEGARRMRRLLREE